MDWRGQVGYESVASAAEPIRHMPLKAAIVPVTPFQQNCTLLWDEDTKRGAVVDPGGDLDRIEAGIKQTGMTVEKILLTHGHIDHAAGAAELKEKLGGIPIELSAAIRNTIVNIGITRSSPPYSAISRVCRRSYTIPTIKKSMPVEIPWLICWMMEPWIPIGFSEKMPSVQKPR